MLTVVVERLTQKACRVCLRSSLLLSCIITPPTTGLACILQCSRLFVPTQGRKGKTFPFLVAPGYFMVPQSSLGMSTLLNCKIIERVFGLLLFSLEFNTFLRVGHLVFKEFSWVRGK